MNFIITSDHGMTNIKKEAGVEYVKLEDYITEPADVYKIIDYGAVVSVAATQGKVDSVSIKSNYG